MNQEIKISTEEQRESAERSWHVGDLAFRNTHAITDVTPASVFKVTALEENNLVVDFASEDAEWGFSGNPENKKTLKASDCVYISNEDYAALVKKYES